MRAKVRCLCGGLLRIGQWNGDERHQLSVVQCTDCGKRLALHIKLEALAR